MQTIGTGIADGALMAATAIDAGLAVHPIHPVSPRTTVLAVIRVASWPTRCATLPVLAWVAGQAIVTAAQNDSQCVHITM
jgi:hypothetical protein